MCRFPSLGLLVWYAPHAHPDGGPWSTRHQVRGVVAAPQRAPAALGVGGRGAAAGAWWRARGRAGGWRQRDDRPQGRVRVGGRRGAVLARPRPQARWGTHLRRPAGPRPRPGPVGAGRAGRAWWPGISAAVDTKSLRHLAEELTRQGHPVSAPTVGRLLRREGFSLQANVKTLEGAQHPDRDAQFRYLNEQVKDHQADGEPVVSVDTKKREQLGRLPMAGREWRPKGQPVKVEDHHFFFTGPDVEQAIGYGIYDLTRNTGWVNVGVDHDTSVFAVESIGRWWRARGSRDYPKASRLLITADAGGSRRLPLPGLEERAGGAGGRDGAGGHGLPLPAGHLQDARIDVKRLG